MARNAVAERPKTVAEVQKRWKIGNQKKLDAVAEVASRLPISETIETRKAKAFSGLLPKFPIESTEKLNRDIRARIYIYVCLNSLFQDTAYACAC